MLKEEDIPWKKKKKEADVTENKKEEVESSTHWNMNLIQDSHMTPPKESQALVFSYLFAQKP